MQMFSNLKNSKLFAAPFSQFPLPNKKTTKALNLHNSSSSSYRLSFKQNYKIVFRNRRHYPFFANCKSTLETLLKTFFSDTLFRKQYKKDNLCKFTWS